jgi:hypothetical protein
MSQARKRKKEHRREVRELREKIKNDFIKKNTINQLLVT